MSRQRGHDADKSPSDGGAWRENIRALVRPPSAIAPARSSKQSRKALRAHSGARPTKEIAARDEFESIRGEQLDEELKGQRVLLNVTRQSGGAARMFRRGLISPREHLAAIKLCELYEIARSRQLIGRPNGQRIDDGGKWRTADERLLAAADAHDMYRTVLDNLGRAQRVLVESVIVHGMPIEQVVQMRSLAHRLVQSGSRDRIRRNVTLGYLMIAEGLELLANRFGFPEI